MSFGQPQHRSNGVGCPPDGSNATAETEVLPPYNPNERGPIAVRVDRATLQNPCFWILVGALGLVIVGGVIYYATHRDD